MILKFLSKKQRKKKKTFNCLGKNYEDGYFAIQKTKLGYYTKKDIISVYKEARIKSTFYYDRSFFCNSIHHCISD